MNRFFLLQPPLPRATMKVSLNPNVNLARGRSHNTTHHRHSRPGGGRLRARAWQVSAAAAHNDQPPCTVASWRLWVESS